MRLDEQNLVAWLQDCGVLPRDVEARVEPAGKGNLNFVRRVRPARGPSWIVKQARPGVEGFPDFPLSSERIVFEWRYLEKARALAPTAAALLPAVRHFDAEARVLVSEDLGEGDSLDALLRLGRAPLAALLAYGAGLAAIHSATAAHAAALEPEFANTEMRRMNGLQMLIAPYAESAPELPTALGEPRAALLADRALRARVADLAAHYAGDREALVHGDAKAKNVIVQGERPRLIDAEFSHVGDPAFDLGVAWGHLVLCGATPAGRGALDAAVAALVEGYRDASGPEERIARAALYAGAVVLAHLIGPSRQAFEQTGDGLEALERGRALLLG